MLIFSEPDFGISVPNTGQFVIKKTGNQLHHLLYKRLVLLLSLKNIFF